MMITIALAIIAFMVLAVIVTTRIGKATHARMQRAAMSGEGLSRPLKFLFLFDFVWLVGDNLYYENKDGRTVVDINELQEVRYRYNVVPSYIGVLELIPRYGRPTSLDVSIPGMTEVISGLEKRLPGLTRSRMIKCVKTGDVEDNCVIWKAA
jgi:hypothetical protein